MMIYFISTRSCYSYTLYVTFEAYLVFRKSTVSCSVSTRADRPTLRTRPYTCTDKEH